MYKVWRALAVLIVTGAAVAIFALGPRTYRQYQSAVRKETLGLTRGEIVDRKGRPIAFTRSRGGRADRRYAFPHLATLIGYRDGAGKWQGIERKYSAFLDGLQVRRDWRTFFLHVRGIPVRGGTVRLTIDATLQRAAEKILGTRQGAIVVLAPRTGDVRAWVGSSPCASTEPSSSGAVRTCGRSKPLRPRDRIAGALFPSGSTYKILTLSAALDTGRYKLNSTFTGIDAFGPSPYFDNTLYGVNLPRGTTEVTLEQALAYSDNYVFAHVGAVLGTATLRRYAQRFYVGRQIPFLVPVIPSTMVGGRTNPSPAELAMASFGGAGDFTTPLQTALLGAAVANQGKLMEPRLVKDLETPSGRVRQRFRPRLLSRVMSPRAAGDVLEAMKAVVRYGTGVRAQIKGVVVAGKTGTAASSGKPHAWFLGIAPADHPTVVAAILHEFSGEASIEAAPLAKDVLRAALRSPRRGHALKRRK